jgi:hypothetical protein
MKIRVSCRIEPSGFFGLPDANITPIPFTHYKQMRFHADMTTGETTVTVDGLESTFRRDDEKLKLATTVLGVRLDWIDTIVVMKPEVKFMTGIKKVTSSEIS